MLLPKFWSLVHCHLRKLPSLTECAVGKVAGSFYQIVVDNEPWALLHALLHAGALYTICAGTAAAGVYLSGRLALTWRGQLAAKLHRQYCATLATGPLPPHIDSPDQRMTAELAELCEVLSTAARLGAGAPFRICFYGWLARRYIGWTGVASAVAFFCIGAAAQRSAGGPLAATLFAQERMEGRLRYAHLRLREHSPEVAAWRGGDAELHALHTALDPTLRNQGRVVAWRSALTGVTRLTDYAGALLNYCLVAAVVFWKGVPASGGGSGSGGEIAQFVSNASFVTLALIYTLTELLDLADNLARLAALTARVGGLSEVLSAAAARSSEQQSIGEGGGVGERAQELQTSSGCGPSLQNLIYNFRLFQCISWRCRSTALLSSVTDSPASSHADFLHCVGLAALVMPPRPLSFLDGAVQMEVSLHKLGPALQNEAAEIFPEMPPPSELLCCMTFQFAGGGSIDLSPDRSTTTLQVAATEMDRLLDNYLRWEGAVRAQLALHGAFWCNSVDPRT